MQAYLPVLLASLLAFHVKHFLFDFVFQTKYQLKNKGHYGHPGGLLHSGLHAVGSIPAILIWAPPHWLLGALVGGEFVMHYHTDWLKERILKKFGWTSAHYGFWVALGVDQLIHGATYLVAVGILCVITQS